MVYAKNANEQKALGKYWGEKHGYWGTSGGWIYHEVNSTTRKKHEGKGRYKGTIRPVCQGWVKLYQAHWKQIERHRQQCSL